MNDDKRGKSRVGLLFIVFLVLFVGASMIEWTPFYYKKILNAFKSEDTNSENGKKQVSTNGTTATPGAGKETLNAEIRKKLENGGGINFSYNYIPSDRAWDTMYTYSVYRRGNSGDCSFSCTRYTLEKDIETLCNCYYSEEIWNNLIDLILNKSELKDFTSVYDDNGMVVSTPIAKTVSLAGGVYSPRHIDEIEAFFKKLAMNAGVSASELDWNIPIDDAKIADKSTVQDLRGSFLWNPVGSISSQEKQQLEAYLRSKYEETGVRLYIILYNNDNTEDIKKAASKMIGRATSPALVFGVTSTQKNWTFRYRIDKDRESALRDGADQLTEAYNIKGSLYEKLMSVINRIYELY